MNSITESVTYEVEAANRQIELAHSEIKAGQDWCLRANTANWDSPAAAIFSRWLAELVLTARHNAQQLDELRAITAQV